MSLLGWFDFLGDCLIVGDLLCIASALGFVFFCGGDVVWSVVGFGGLILVGMLPCCR